MKRKKARDREPERTHLQHFASVFPEFPAGKRDFDGEKPDLVVHMDKGDLGIEHTQLVRVEAVRGAAPQIVLPQNQEELRRRVIDTARNVFEKRGGAMLQVYAFFSRHDKNALTKSAVDEAALKLADVVAHAVLLSSQEIQDGYWRNIERWNYDEHIPDLFPSQIDSIEFCAVDQPGKVIWGVPDGGFVPTITAEYIQQKIDAKDSKVKNYLTRCSEVWLVLVADNGVLSSYFNISQEVANLTYQSLFNRVFYFENFDRKVVELSIAGK